MYCLHKLFDPALRTCDVMSRPIKRIQTGLFDLFVFLYVQLQKMQSNQRNKLPYLFCCCWWWWCCCCCCCCCLRVINWSYLAVQANASNEIKLVRYQSSKVTKILLSSGSQPFSFCEPLNRKKENSITP